jgi:solute carrier family 10 (sodium/bile acid cotransporter), member 7
MVRIISIFVLMNWKGFVPDTFVVGLVVMVLAAWISPFNDATAWIPLKEVIYWGITGIFFLYGAKLKPAELRRDMRNCRLHLLIQSTTFLLIPLLILSLYPLFAGSEYFTLWLALLFLGALPSTVSSSVVMVSIAGGNIPSAIFNASISGLIGLVATPLWMSFFLPASEESVAYGELTQQLIAQILLPVTVGLLANSWLSGFVTRHKSRIAWFDKFVIFLIIYKSFSAAFLSGVFTAVPNWLLLALSIGVILLFFLIYYGINTIAKRLQFNTQDRITALFCGSKKSLVHGSVFVLLLIPDAKLQSLFLLPIMIYHACQLLFTSIVSRRFANTQRQ